ncbi:bifunctional metallophosphatase/5'-nucleotidase [Aliidiomarina soli]|uniref:Bifunctional metallophosphatase/5'-nucleotidase n=1 Tax=Aliidiomarina soli TaxID=1928574 RepID=A0A432WJU3_9GAMM|nr:bifunctional metallophosphatase/5'-nucleotidase [Aliidiomarina soli]RUO34001.1 bifunctional metallophosphatase/5'-nucleotidase [Aliidiomarina soli]
MRHSVTRCIRIASVMWASMLLISCSSQTIQSSEYEFSLQIAHINDTHSAFEPTPGQFSTPHRDVFNQWGGHPRLASRLQQYRLNATEAGQPLLVLHGGDAWQGSAYFKLNEGQMNADILSRMQIDAMALGNHEFDLNNARLNDFISRVNFPVLAANIDASDDADLGRQTNLQPFTLFAFKREQKRSVTPAEMTASLSDEVSRQQAAGFTVVAVFGLVLDDMPTIAPNTGDVDFFDLTTSAQRTVDQLQAAGVDKIIALTHIGNALDVKLASQVNGIDAIVGGHSHSLLGDFSNLGLATSQRPYAERVNNPNGTTTTCIVQAGEYAQAAGLLHLSFDAQGELTRCEGGNTLLSNADWYQDQQRTLALEPSQNQTVHDFISGQPNIAVIDEDPALREHIDRTYQPALKEAYGEVIVHLTSAISHLRRPGDNDSDHHGSRLAPLIAHAQYAFAAQPEVIAETGLQPDFALVGAGGIRSGLDAGELHEGIISLEVLPFASQLAIVPLQGKVIRQVITETVEATLPEGAHAGRYPYGGMLRYQFVETQAGEHGELRQLEVNTGTLQQPDWQSLNDNTRYNVVVNSYLANGNDGWTAFYQAQRERSERVDLAYHNGHLQAFPVDKIIASDGGYRPRYQGLALACDDPVVRCNTDAVAVIEFMRRFPEQIQSATEPTVTLLRP